LRWAALNRIEVSQIESADAESLDIRPRHGLGISPRNDVARHPIDRCVLLTPAPTRSDREAMSNIHDTQHLELRQ
jgi:hypothetical protein